MEYNIRKAVEVTLVFDLFELGRIVRLMEAGAEVSPSTDLEDKRLLQSLQAVEKEAMR